MSNRASGHNFAVVPSAEIQRSSFDRSHGHKTTFDAGYLIPVFVDEALPGDTFNLHMSALARLSTPIKPVMDNMYLDSFFFAVPYRLVWDNWQRFNGEQTNPGDTTDYVVPTISATAGLYQANSVFDYMGLPIGPACTHSALPLRAYNLIWNEWFRDQNLQGARSVYKGDGPDSPSDYILNRRGKRHDYFTSCLPWPQKGPAVELSLGTTAPVVPNGTPPTWQGTDAVVRNLFQESSVGNATWGGGGPFLDSAMSWNDPALHADLTSATAVTINSMRQAFQVQRMYERDARGGTRYTELIRAHFGVVSPDARLQRPEYLGGGSTPINFHPVTQTSGTSSAGGYTPTPQGNLSAFATGLARDHGFVKSFTEHCIIIGLVCVRADMSYQQGLNRMWSRSTRFDFFWPALAHLGEQAVLNKEIFAQGTSEDEDVFGYQERYAEYRYKPNLITGEFRSSFAQSLDIWHLAQDYATLPILNETFIEENPPVDRIVAVPTEPHFLFDSSFKFICARPMPVYSVPGMIDHF